MYIKINIDNITVVVLTLITIIRSILNCLLMSTENSFWVHTTGIVQTVAYTIL
jgi:hypothetical protein